MAAMNREIALERARRHGALLMTLAGLSAIAVTIGAIAQWRDAHFFLVNTSQSLPNWAFMVRRAAAPSRGDYVFFSPPSGELVRRHFGARPPLFGKIVYGLPGDVIAHDGVFVRINGKIVSRMKAKSFSGELLTPGTTGTIPHRCYYVGTPHPDGFDSRYAQIGLVCAKQIVGIGEPVL